METGLIKVREMTVGMMLQLVPLLVTNVTARKTKAGKPYLALDFFDGTESISGNYWDWKGTNMPDKGTVLEVIAQVTEWAGNKQLNISGLATSVNFTSAHFMPVSDCDVSEVYRNAHELINTMNDMFLKALTRAIFDQLETLWKTVPGAIKVHHNFLAGTLIHSVSVATIAKRMSDSIAESNMDLCIAGGLLHDLGKLFTYTMDGANIVMTDEGLLYGHLFIGTEFVGNFAESFEDYGTLEEKKVEVLRHIIASHHGKQEYGAIVTPACMEAHIVHYADAMDAAAEQIRVASDKAGTAKWTERLYAVGNTPHLSTTYILELFLGNTVIADE